MDALTKIFRRGVFTSEFLVTLMAMALPVLDSFVNGGVAAAGGPAAFTGGLIAAVYVFVRGWIKAKAAGATLTESGNRVAPGLGSAAAEAQYREASS